MENKGRFIENRIITLITLLVILITVSGCQDFDISELSDEDMQRIAENAITCNKPYMRFASGCCLDQNENNICDEDE